MTICQLDWQQYNFDPSLSILEFFVDPFFAPSTTVIRWLVMILLKKMPVLLKRRRMMMMIIHSIWDTTSVDTVA